MKTKTPLSSFMMVPILSITGNIIASLLFIFLLKDPSPVPVFAFFATINLLCIISFALLPAKAKAVPRFIARLFIGGALIFFSIAGMQNFQIEGLFFSAFAGLFTGTVLHFMMAKIIFPIIYGRTWCGWNCWTMLFLDLLPYKSGANWKKGLSKLRYLHFVGSLTLCAVLAYGFNYLTIYLKGYDPATGAGNMLIVHWFVAGNIFYYLAGAVFAIILKDNHAVCKYVCPTSLFLKFSNLLSISRIAGNAALCDECGNCTAVCAKKIDILKFIKAGKRVLSSECMLCLKCIAICPNNVLKASAGFDLGVIGGYHEE